MTKRIIFGVIFMVVVAVLASRGGFEVRESGPVRVVVLALDAGTWDLLDPFMARGLLPNLKKLRDGGASATLMSIQPSSSPVIWTTVATGKMPDKHGIDFFVRFPDGDTGNPQPVSRTMRKTKAVWNILSEAGYDVAVVGWFVTWPAGEVNGRLITDRAHYGSIDKRAFPPFYAESIVIPRRDDMLADLPRFMDFEYDPKRVNPDSRDPTGLENFLVMDRFERAYLRDLYYRRATDKVLDDGPLPDFLAVYLRGTDDVQHGFWKYMDPEPFGNIPDGSVGRFGRVIEAYWQWVDEAVGDILARYGRNTLVFVVSDHGAGPAVGYHRVVADEHRHLSGSHRDRGILIASGPGIAHHTRLDAVSVRDLTPTILYAMGLPVGRDMDGRPLTELFGGQSSARRVRYVASYDEEGEAVAPEPLASEADPEILRHLRSLGYID